MIMSVGQETMFYKTAAVVTEVLLLLLLRERWLDPLLRICCLE